MCVLRPAELVKGIQTNDSHWFHTDQSPKKKGFHCVQGILNLEDVGSEDASFACYPKSHKLNKELFLRNKADSPIDFYMLSEEDIAWVEQEKGPSQTCNSKQGKFHRLRQPTAALQFCPEVSPRESKMVLRNLHLHDTTHMGRPKHTAGSH